jgi:hypothetical protein
MWSGDDDMMWSRNNDVIRCEAEIMMWIDDNDVIKCEVMMMMW